MFEDGLFTVTHSSRFVTYMHCKIVLWIAERVHSHLDVVDPDVRAGDVDPVRAADIRAADREVVDLAAVRARNNDVELGRVDEDEVVQRPASD
jgi:hypothetical protein